jgi:lipopolysaccharide biosynthesis protein
MKANARVIAFYLPQYHPIPENDEWWGKGFTEWTNVGKAKSLFRGHYQPNVPADLGYYDLRVPETRKAQADLAREHGIEGFCYWHYWFGNKKRLLERPFNEVVASGEPDFPFCLAWANDSWKGFAYGINNRNLLIEQLYPGVKDYTDHFYEVLPAFKDKRYILIDGKPIFLIYRPLADKEIVVFIETWRRLALENGLKGIFFIGHILDSRIKIEDVMECGVDAVNVVRLDNYQLNYRSIFMRYYKYFNKLFRGIPQTYSYKKVSKYFTIPEIDANENVFPSIIPGWDHSPRSSKEALILTDPNPESFGRHVEDVLSSVDKKTFEKRIVFIKSWNEWAEGNYMEPDLRFGKKFLEVLKSKLF